MITLPSSYLSIFVICVFHRVVSRLSEQCAWFRMYFLTSQNCWESLCLCVTHSYTYILCADYYLCSLLSVLFFPVSLCYNKFFSCVCEYCSLCSTSILVYSPVSVRVLSLFSSCVLSQSTLLPVCLAVCLSNCLTLANICRLIFKHVYKRPADIWVGTLSTISSLLDPFLTLFTPPLL